MKIYIYIYIYIGCFPVAGMRKKNDVKKKKKFLDSSSSFEHEQIVVVKFWRKIPVFAQEKEFVIKLLKISSLYELQCSSYCI